MTQPAPITVSVIVNADAPTAWRAFTDPQAVTQWNFASPDWACPRATNDLRAGGRLNYRMEARDGSMGFDYEGEIVEVVEPRLLRYRLGPEREVVAVFEPVGGQTVVSHSFTPETTFPVERQQAGWQAILDHYKAYVERDAA